MGLMTIQALRQFEHALQVRDQQERFLASLQRRAQGLVDAALRRLGLGIHVPLWHWAGAAGARAMRVAGSWVIHVDLVWLAQQEWRSGKGAFENPILHEVGHIAVRELGLLPPSQHDDELAADRMAARVAESLRLDHAGAEAVLARTGGCDDPRLCTHPPGARRVAEYRRTWVGFMLARA